MSAYVNDLDKILLIFPAIKSWIFTIVCKSSPLAKMSTINGYEHKPRKVLARLCRLNNYSKPRYTWSSKKEEMVFEEKNLVYKCYIRNIYKYRLTIDGNVFYGKSISKRMAKNFAVNEAIKHLTFKTCGRDAITELVGLCLDHRLSAPVFTETLREGVYSVKGELELEVDQKKVRLEETGCDESPKRAKLIAAKDILDQLIVILGYMESVKKCDLEQIDSVLDNSS